jgi:hypothetical protein
MSANGQKEMLQRFMESINKRRPRNPHEVVELIRLGLVDKKGKELTEKGKRVYGGN